jgi:hypothetical protein
LSQKLLEVERLALKALAAQGRSLSALRAAAVAKAMAAKTRSTFLCDQFGGEI